MERRTVVLLAAVGLACTAVCGGFAWTVVRIVRGLDPGDGLTPIDDPRPAHVVVRVTDDAGRPVAGATVEAFLEPPFWGDFESSFGFDPSSEPRAALTETTGPDGSATFDALASGDWVVAVRSPGRATSFSRLTGGHAARHEVRVQLGVARSLRGRVLDGDPVEGAMVLACDSSDRHFREAHWLMSVRARSGPRGEFVLDGLASGVIALWVVRPGDVPVEAGRVLVPTCASMDLPIPSRGVKATVGSAAGTAVPARSDTAARSRIHGQVVSRDGTPLDGACVAALHHGEYGGEEVLAWTSSGPDGAFALAGIPSGADIALRISAQGHRTFTTDWDDADDFSDATTYRLDRGARIAGRVATPDGAAPRDVRVWLYRLGDDEDMAFNGLSVLWAGTPMWWSKAAPTTVGEDGRFETTWDYDPGRLVAYATADGFAPTVSQPFDVAPGAPPARVDVVLDPGVTLRCRLVGPDGLPVANRPVRIRPPAFVNVWGATSAVTDEAGRFSVEHLPARPVVLSVGSFRTRQHRDATVTPGPAEIEVRLAARAKSDDDEDD